MIQRVETVAEGKNPIHLDLFTIDLAAEIRRLEALGARKIARYAQWGAIWASLTDPDGYVFDLVERSDPRPPSEGHLQSEPPPPREVAFGPARDNRDVSRLLHALMSTP